MVAQGIVRQSAAMERKRTFLACRYMLVLAVSGILFMESGRDTPPLLLPIFVLMALLSNVILSRVPAFSFFDAAFQAPMLIADTAMICVALLLTGSSQQMFLFFFFVLIAAAKIDNLVMLAVAAAAIGLISSLLADTTGTTTLMRIPFMFAVGVFFGYVVLPERTGEFQRTKIASPAPIGSDPVRRPAEARAEVAP